MPNFDQNLKNELAKKCGLVLLGSYYSSLDFSFERPFCLYNSVGLADFRGGAYSYINASSSFRNASVGRYCSISANVVAGVGKHPHDMTSTSTSANVLFGRITSSGILAETNAPFSEHSWYPERTIIGSDVWIGMNALFVGAHEVKIGNGAVIAANSVVTKDAPPYSVIAGNPARVVKMRFKDELCADLNDSKWWDYDFKDFKAQNSELCARFNPGIAPSEFLAWFKAEGKEILEPFRIKSKVFALKLENNEIKIKEINE